MRHSIFEGLLATIESLRTQVYRDWRLEILASDADTGRALGALIAEAAEDLAERIDVIDASDEAAFDQPIGSADQSTTLRLVGLLSRGRSTGLRRIAADCAGQRAAPRCGHAVRGRSADEPGEPRTRAVLQAGFLARPAAFDQLYRPPVVCLDGAARTQRRDGARSAAGRRIRCRAAMHGAGGAGAPCARPAVPARCAADRRCGAGGGRTDARRGTARHRGRGAGRRGTWHLALPANAAGNRHGVDHHPDLRRAGLHRDLHQVAARAHRLSQLRDRLRRQHPGRPGRLEDLAAAERRQGRADAGRVQLVAFQQPRCRRRRRANICCS